MKQLLRVLVMCKALLVIAIAIFPTAEAQTDFSAVESSPFSKQGISVESVWEPFTLQFSFDATAASGGGGNSGAEFDGTYYYTTRWASNLIHKYDTTGILIEQFSIPGVTGLRDLAFDGTYMYGSNATTTIYQMDFDAHMLIGTIPGLPVAVRHIAYDPVADGFWIGNWDTPITLVNRSGTTLNSISGHGLVGMYGSAYDGWTDGGPYLWIFDQGGGADAPQLLHQFEIATGRATMFVYDVGGDFSSTGSLAGGLFAVEGTAPGTSLIGGILQGTPSWFFLYKAASFALRLEWARDYGTPEEPVTGVDFDVDPSGNICVLGTKTQSSGQRDLVAIRYDPSGDEQWVHEIEHPDAYLTASGVAVHRSGNVVVTGKSTGSTPGFTGLVTVGLDSMGNETWRTTYDNPLDDFENNIGVGVDSIGNSYVVGSSYISFDREYDFLAIKYSPNGTQLWASSAGYFSGGDVAADFAVDPGGWTYVTGRGVFGDHTAYITAVFSPTGPYYLSSFDDAGEDDEAAAVTYDGAGNVYVTGMSDDQGGFNLRCVTVKLNRSGVVEWSATYFPGVDTGGRDICVLDDGSVFVVAQVGGESALVKYNASGIEEWVVRFPSYYARLVPSGPDVYVGFQLGSSIVIAKYGGDGQILWEHSYDSPLASHTFSNMIVDQGGEILILATTGNAISTLKFTPVSSGTLSVESRVTPRSGGESLELGFRVMNDSDEDVTADIWVDLINPAGSSKEILLKADNDIPAQRGFSETKQIELKEGSAPGDYSFVVNVGTYPDEILGSAVAVYTKKDSVGQEGLQADIGNTANLIGEIPTVFSLNQNYPNPFNPSTVIRYGVPVRSTVRLEVFNVLGQSIGLLVNDVREAGYHEAQWQHSIASGVYLYKMVATPLEGEGEAYTEVRKMLMMK